MEYHLLKLAPWTSPFLLDNSTGNNVSLEVCLWAYKTNLWSQNRNSLLLLLVGKRQRQKYIYKQFKNWYYLSLEILCNNFLKASNHLGSRRLNEVKCQPSLWAQKPGLALLERGPGWSQPVWWLYRWPHSAFVFGSKVSVTRSLSELPKALKPITEILPVSKLASGRTRAVFLFWFCNDTSLKSCGDPLRPGLV